MIIIGGSFVDFVVLVLTGFFSNSAIGSKNGDSCTIKATGIQGKCILTVQCAEALQNIKKGIIPQLCGFSGVYSNSSMVCCTQNTLKTKKPGEIAKKKCKEFHKYTRRILLPSEAGILVVGGTRASRREFPHVALIGLSIYENPEPKDIAWSCGGSLISENFILTAGHCIHTRHGEPRVVKIGVTEREVGIASDHNLQQIRVVKHYTHTEYRSPAHYHDIGLLKLERKVKMEVENARPACLHTTKDLPKEKFAACGWGLTQFAGKESQHLLKVELELFTQPQCSDTYLSDIGGSRLGRGIDDNLMICAGSSKEIKDTCQGDSGGPLQVAIDTTEMRCEKKRECLYDIIGITSFGKACGLAIDTPGVYTRVSHYLKWIEDIVWPNE